MKILVVPISIKDSIRNVEKLALKNSSEISFTFYGNFENLEDLVDFWNNISSHSKGFDYIWVYKGGINAIDLLFKLDLKQLNIEVPIIGSSDFTHILMGLKKFGTYRKLLYGPNFTEVNDVNFLSYLKKQDYTLNLTSINNAADEYVPGNIFGGNLQILLNMCGTEYFPNLNGVDLFIEHHYIKETYDSTSYWIKLLLYKLKSTNVKSVIFNNLTFNINTDELATKEKQIELIKEICQAAQLPVYFLKESYKIKPIIFS